MNKEETLRKLRSGEPLFTDSLPKPAFRRVMGLEEELGTTEDNSKDTDFILIENKPIDIDQWQINGGRLYFDIEHPEAATPEVSDPLRAALYMEAMVQLAIEKNFSQQLYANNRGKVRDDKGKFATYGCHENYATSASREDLLRLVPFLIARTVLVGSGFCNEDGLFEISQRAAFIEQITSAKTQSERGLLGSRVNENHDLDDERVKEKRLHLITSDTNLCQVQTFMKMGFMSLIIRMIEEGKLPVISYTSGVCDDLHALSLKTGTWISDKKIGGIDQ